MSSEPSPNPQAIRLTAERRRALKVSLLGQASAGESITVAKTRSAASQLLGLDLSQEVAEKTLLDFGFQMSNDVEPYLGSGGQLESSRIWVVAPGPKPLTPSDRAGVLAGRLKVLTDAFVEDLLEDPQLQFADIGDRATEATRLFALTLSRAVQARARFAAQKIIPSCADVASLTFKGAAQAAKQP